MKVIIIEDEHLMAEELEMLVKEYDEEIEIPAILTTVEEAITYLENHPMPDLFFSDIQLPDGISFEIFKEIENTTPVIFCTAYDEYALDAFKANGIDYILKPFDSETIAKTLEKFENLTQINDASQSDLMQMMSSLMRSQNEISTKENILVHKGDKIIPLPTQDIAAIHLDAGITYAYTFDNTKYALEQSMDKLEHSLSDSFYRANRQFIIHKKAIVHVSKYFNRKLMLKTKISLPEQIVVSKANATSFLKWLEN